jgi:ubiquinone/menaquinone biosynthesis C-methylase UbiE
LKNSDRVLDFGCGPGSFVAVTSQYCGEIIGVDIGSHFTTICEETIRQLNLKNAKALQVSPGTLPFQDHYFDAVIMVDVIHHLDNIAKHIEEVFRVIRPGGRVLIFEPNKLNPMIAVMHALDRNEWGLLKLGTPSKYREILSPYLEIDEISFNGIVIGPESGVFPMISDFLNKDYVHAILGWLNPKIFISGRRR